MPFIGWITSYQRAWLRDDVVSGIVVGMVAHLIFPAIPSVMAVAATTDGTMVATTKAPIFSALFVAALVQTETAPVIAIAVIVGMLAGTRVSMMPAPKTAASK